MAQLAPMVEQRLGEVAPQQSLIDGVFPAHSIDAEADKTEISITPRSSR